MRWRAPVSYDAESTARLLREALDALGYAYTRDAGTRAYEENVIALSLPRVTATHRFRVTHPGDFVVEAYDTRPSPGGLIPYLEVLGFLPESEPAVRALLTEVARRAPRPPWDFTWGQRLALGLLRSEYRTARREWQRMLPPPRAP